MNKKIGKLGNAAKYKFFENYVQPFLENIQNLNSIELTIFFDIAERAFFFGVGKEEGKAVRSYLNACNKIYSHTDHKNAVEEIFKAILTEIEYAATYRVNQVLEKESDNKIRHDLEYYTVLTENFIKIFITPIYYYVHVYHGKPSKAQLPEEYVNVGIIQKINTISSAKLSVPGIDLSLLVKGLDMRIRHGGTAHEHWEILDDDKVQIKNIHPETGKVKDDFILTSKELSERIKELEKLVWVLRLGFYAFFHNSGMRLENKKPRTKYGIQQYAVNFAKDRVLDLEIPFEWDEKNCEIRLKIKYETPSKVYPGGELILVTGVFEIINKVDTTSYKFHVLDILKYLSFMIDTEKYKCFKVQIFFDNKEITTATYLIEDLFKIDKDDTFIPTAIAGNDIPEDLKIKFISEITVPKGFKNIILEDLKKRYPESEFI